MSVPTHVATPYAMARSALAGRSWGYTLGTLRMWQQYGQAYAEIFRGGLTAGGIVGVIAHWWGVTSKPTIIVIGFSTVIFFQILGTFCGYLAWRHKVIQHTFGADWKNDPWKVRMLAAMEAERHCRLVPGQDEERDGGGEP